MTGGREDERGAGSPPHRDDRLWLHPSELRAGASVPPAPPVRRRHRLPVGTALVAGATGALAMFVAVTIVGPPPSPTTGTSPTTVRAEVAAAFLTTAALDATVQVELPDGPATALVVDDAGHLVLAAALEPGRVVEVRTSRLRDVPATAVARAGATLTVLHAPDLRWIARPADATDVTPGGPVTAMVPDGDTVGRARILARRFEGRCTSLAESTDDLDGRLVVDDAGRPAGLVAADTDPTDHVVLVVPATVALQQAGRALSGLAPTCT